MEKQEVVVDQPVATNGVTVIPVVEVSLNCWHHKGGISFFGAKRLVSLVVVSPSARRAFRVTGEEVSLDQLTQEAPGVKEILERI